MGTEMKSNFSDDEEDLEALRLAALSSLKKKNEANGLAQNQRSTNEKNYNFTKGMFRGGKRRYFPGQAGRNGRSGQFKNQLRNSNLISIPTITDEKETPQLNAKSSKFINKDEDIPKLIRPQDRYACTIEQEIENDGTSSKFDRYDNSNSESEEEDEISNAKLERSDSLEALMEELDAEIQGEHKKEKKDKLKKKEITTDAEEKKEQITNSESEKVENNNDKTETSSCDVIVHNAANIKENVPNTSNESADIEVKVEISKLSDQIANKNSNLRSPGRRKIPNRKMNGRIFNPDPSFVPPPSNPIMISNLPIMNSLQTSQFTTVYNSVPPFTGPELFPVNVPPPTFIPPSGLQPHIMPIDVPPTDFNDYNIAPFRPLVVEPPGPLSSIPMGPLSPRSAAFVLQNRAIVEKRKRSPRRSYSRSPSPHRLRYSKSPTKRRSVSPFRRSLTPIRRSSSPRRSLSPRRSPLRRSLSPYRRHPRKESPRRSPRRIRDSPKRSPKRSRESPKRLRESRRTPIKDRLGSKGKNEEKDSNKKEEPVPSISKTEEVKPVDPVLEARKKKFESKEIKVKEGVIRLKPKDEIIRKEKIEENTKVKIEEKVENVKVKEPSVKRIEDDIFTKPPVKEETTSTRIVLLPKMKKKVFRGNLPKRTN
ncbi:hypothetical protein HHI36_014568 [Cryptolaemus montrouzieri]|uniref:Uncharacterized protein n=1 Tax=Cryptolaemus montrouzieri TaxID=559131 RepID=A0ABD2N3B6_9CUCU